jgi:Ca-activated chloride channel family protein
VRRLLRELSADRFGLVAFAGRAYVLSPVTIDHSAIELYLDALDPGIASQGGSSLQSALLQATDLARGVDAASGDRVNAPDGGRSDRMESSRPLPRRPPVRVFTVGWPPPAPGSEVDPPRQARLQARAPGR